ncbi:hypothetical protein GUJ93_ZPchr0012g20157 [Zizania palustris]|uniref:Uncharacterized protein n=1 Tax=Zizania palustris TaxID=103762 RepID=A0A8J5WMA8_ZIZPA|nr:hypothetical protein GUJ93_ZPchr0012g20157 [Zizania palustris]
MHAACMLYLYVHQFIRELRGSETLVTGIAGTTGATFGQGDVLREPKAKLALGIHRLVFVRAVPAAGLNTRDYAELDLQPRLAAGRRRLLQLPPREAGRLLRRPNEGSTAS